MAIISLGVAPSEFNVFTTSPIVVVFSITLNFASGSATSTFSFSLTTVSPLDKGLGCETSNSGFIVTVIPPCARARNWV